MSNTRLADVKTELTSTTSSIFKAWHVPSTLAHKDSIDIFPNGNLGLFTAAHLIGTSASSLTTFSSLRIVSPITAKIRTIDLPLHSDKLVFIDDHLLLSDPKSSILFNLTDSTHKKTRWQFDTKRMFPLSKTTVAHIVPLEKEDGDTEDDKADNTIVSFVEIHDTKKISTCEASLLYKLKLINVRLETIVSITQLDNYLAIGLTNGFVVALPKNVDGKFSDKSSRVIHLTEQPLNNLALTALENDRLLCSFYDIKSNKTQIHLLTSENLTTQNKRSKNKHLETSLSGKCNNHCAATINNQTLLFINSFSIHFINTESLKKNSIVLPNTTLDHLTFNDDKIFIAYQKKNSSDKYIISFEKKSYAENGSKDAKEIIIERTNASVDNPHMLFNGPFKDLDSFPTVTVAEEESAKKTCCAIM